jgi:hypothetical protein
VAIFDKRVPSEELREILNKGNIPRYINAALGNNNKDLLNPIKFRNMFLNQNPDLKNDQRFLMAAELSGIFIPLAGSTLSLIYLWSSNILSNAFKKRYIEEIRRDVSLVRLARELDINLNSINRRGLKSIVNRARMVATNVNKRIIIEEEKRMSNTERMSRAKWAAITNEIVKLLAYIVILVSMGLKFIKVAGDLGRQSVVNEESGYYVVNLIARYLYILKKMTTLIGGAVFTSGLRSIGILNYRQNSYAVASETVSAVLSYYGSRLIVNTQLVNYIQEQLLEIDRLVTRPLSKTASFISDISAMTGLTSEAGNKARNSAIEMLRAIRNLAIKLNIALAGVLVSDAVYKIRGAMSRVSQPFATRPVIMELPAPEQPNNNNRRRAARTLLAMRQR